jgi:hypothetical protein
MLLRYAKFFYGITPINMTCAVTFLAVAWSVAHTPPSHIIIHITVSMAKLSRFWKPARDSLFFVVVVVVVFVLGGGGGSFTASIGFLWVLTRLKTL